MIKAVIFDMDGVLVDSEVYHIEAMKQILEEELNLNVSVEEIGEHAGFTYVDKLKRIFKKKRIKNNIEELSKKINERYIEIIKEKIELSSGIDELLRKISKTSLNTALVTASNKQQTDLVLEKTKTRKYFDIVITGNDVKSKKPDPECYLLAAKKLKLKPEECVVIEDSPVGVVAAKDAKMKCIALPNLYIKHGDFSRADMIINNFKELSLKTIKNF